MDKTTLRIECGGQVMASTQMGPADTIRDALDDLNGTSLVSFLRGPVFIGLTSLLDRLDRQVELSVAGLLAGDVKPYLDAVNDCTRDGVDDFVRESSEEDAIRAILANRMTLVAIRKGALKTGLFPFRSRKEILDCVGIGGEVRRAGSRRSWKLHDVLGTMACLMSAKGNTIEVQVNQLYPVPAGKARRG